MAGPAGRWGPLQGPLSGISLIYLKRPKTGNGHGIFFFQGTGNRIKYTIYRCPRLFLFLDNLCHLGRILLGHCLRSFKLLIYLVRWW